MKKIINLFAAAFLAVSAAAQVPAPVVFDKADGTPNTQKELSRKIGGKAFAKRTSALPDFAKKEAYLLTVTPKGYRIEANTETGAFRALTTLKQMESCGTVYDYPRMQYRGFMFDISRHFRSKDFILKQLEALASIKINRVHIHFTDDAGWRLEIEKYPLLNKQASWRIGSDWSEWVEKGFKYAIEGDPDACGGYLTKADIREILAKAEKLHIEVIPEIEMPSHSREVVFAYPEVGCREGSTELCPGKEATFTFLEGVLDEVAELFPGEYIHIGGDEANKSHWADCPDCQARMKAEGLESLDELQSYLIGRIEKYLDGKGKRLIGWDEILEGGLSPKATVMSWRGTEGGIEAMKQGHDAIMTPGRYCYLDKVQDAPIFQPEGFGGYLPLDVARSYDPMADLPEELKHHLLGVQGNLWAERIPTDAHYEYMMYPRIAAIAEVGWSQPSSEADFRERVMRWNDDIIGKGYNAFDLHKEFGERPACVSGAKHLALGKPVKYNIPWHRRYPAAGAATFTDGICGGWSYGDGRWQGLTSDIDVVIDLESVQDIHYVGGTFMEEPGPDIFLPKQIEVYLSQDGEIFELAATVHKEIQKPSQSYVTLGAVISAKARYVRFVSRQTRGFQFLDEIIVN